MKDQKKFNKTPLSIPEMVIRLAQVRERFGLRASWLIFHWWIAGLHAESYSTGLREGYSAGFESGVEFRCSGLASSSGHL